MLKCFLDMDGVTTDFVGGLCRSLNVGNPYDDPKNHGKYWVQDLIGVSADKVNSAMSETWWANLQPTKECFAIIDMLEELFGQCAICIATKPIDQRGCCDGKIAWIKKNLPQYKEQFLIGKHKGYAASKDAWLIDDSDENVDAFRQVGGNAILVPRPWNSDFRFAKEVLSVLRYRLTNGPALDIFKARN